METPETEINYIPPAEPSIALGQEAQFYLKQAGKWASFLGIVGFVFTGFTLLEALSISTMMATMAKLSPTFPAAAFGGIMTVFCLLGAVVYFLFSLYLYQFGNRAKAGIGFMDADKVTSAFSKLKSFFKLWGILTIIMLALVVLGIVIAIVFAASMGSMMAH